MKVQRQLGTDVPIIFDQVEEPSRDPLQRWATIREAWEYAYAASEEHGAVMVVQDDVDVCMDLLEGLGEGLEEFPATDGRPEFLVSAYTGTGRPNQLAVRRALQVADLRGDAWMATRSLNWGPAICVPAWTVPVMLEAVDTHIRSHKPPRSNTDYAIGVYYRDVLKWRTHYTVPSLVEHLRVPSLVGHDYGPVRRAHRFLGVEKSALSVDWTKAPRNGLVTRLP